jgi:hypothetical protein
MVIKLIGYAMNQQQPENKTGTLPNSGVETFREWWKKVEGRDLTKPEERFLAQLESYQQKHEHGKQLTNQQKRLALLQAEHLGELQ